MAKKEVKLSELGIEGCNFTAKGETAGDVVKIAVEHLRSDHDMDMPDAKTILTGELTKDPLEPVDPAITLIVERLLNSLDIVPPEGSGLSEAMKKSQT